MNRSKTRSHFALIPAAVVCALMAHLGPAHSVPIEDNSKSPDPAIGGITTPAISPSSGPGLASETFAFETSMGLQAALQRGQWRTACSIASNSLAHEETNLDALGVFGMCSALAKDQAASETALRRLREAEGASSYYAAMTEGILQLRSSTALSAETTFKTILKSRSSDPLALYFSGEALHQLKRDPQAIASFKAVLVRWPDHAPALAAAARLLASPKASPRELQEAVAMTERATAIEPMNLDYWKQMAELYKRTGQPGRAAAVTLQWLSPPAMK
jgi:tetratricopeptide (TPR) repeat protein